MSERREAAPLAGRVAVVTGAARGIGRAHAIALADLGAAVVVNDLGADVAGRGRDPAPADDVVAEIRARGGRAVADDGDVASIRGGRALVATAVERLGRLDVLVNNAGFALGGGSVEEPDEPGIDALLDVHLKAAVGTMSAAFPVMRANGYGRIVNTVSEVALDTRFAGPLGYGLAKAAVWSATLSAAEAGRPYGITVNAISPGARTRMNADVLWHGFRDGASARLDLAPEHVAAVVAYLATPAAADITGRVLHVAAGAVREYETRRRAGTELAERIANVVGAASGAPSDG